MLKHSPNTLDPNAKSRFVAFLISPNLIVHIKVETSISAAR